MKAPKKTTSLPAEIIDDWSTRLRLAECTPREFDQMMRLVRYTLPHPSIESVKRSMTGLADAFNHVGQSAPQKTIVSQARKKLNETGHLDAEPHFGLSHPTAAAIIKIQNAAASRKVDPGPWLNWFLQLCRQTQNHSERLTRSTYYYHTIYARDVAIFVMYHQAAGTLPPDQSVDQACRQLDEWFQREAQTGEPMPIPVTGVVNLDEKIDVVSRLIDGTWKFGAPSQKSSETKKPDPNTDRSGDRDVPPDKNTTKAKPLPGILTPTTETLKSTQPKEKQPAHQSLSYKLGEANDAPDPLTTQPAPASDPQGPASDVDSEEIETTNFSAPPEFSAPERRSHYGSLLNVQAARNIASRSDMQRYSRRQLSTWLGQFAEEDSLTAVFLLLVWSLGMAPERLATLRVGTDNPSRDKDVVLILNPISHQLTYRVLNLGATSDTHSPNKLPDNHLMKLTLPASLVQKIAASDHEQPFRDMEKRYKKLRKVISKNLGRGPCTLGQWAASAPACHADRLNTLEAAAFSGSTGFNEKASSAYRRHDRAALNATFGECLTVLRGYWNAEGLMSGPGTEPFADLTITGAYPDGALGSIRYAGPDAVAPVVYAIRNKIKQAKQRVNSPFKTTPLSDLIALLNLQQLNYFLVVQLHTLGRALNNKTTLGFSAEGLWVSDKASHRYRERKLIYAISPQDMAKNRGLLLGQRQECQNALGQLTKLAGALGLKVEQDKPAVADLPCFVNLDRSKKKLKVRRLTPGLWQRALDQLGLSEIWTMVGNAFRHMASTDLSDSFSDALVDELLGHKHPGRDWWGSESSGSFGELTTLTPIIEQWAKQMGLKVVEIDHTLFRGFYDSTQ